MDEEGKQGVLCHKLHTFIQHVESMTLQPNLIYVRRQMR